MLMDVRESRIGNGVRVVTAFMPHVQSVSVGVWLGVGARHETDAQAGAAHFVEHLLFKGTARRSAREISMAIEGRGGYLDAFTQEENTCYYARAACDQFSTVLDVLSDMVLNPRLAAADVAREREVIVEEILMYRDQPAQVVQEMITAALWSGHPLGRPLAGTPETLAKLNRHAIVEFMKRRYRARGLVVAAAGQIEHAACVREVEKRLGVMRRGATLRWRGAADRAPREALAVQAKDIEQVQLAVGIRTFGRHDERRYALRLLNAMLGENMSSRLFQEVREKRGLAYAVQSTFQLFEESGGFFISAGLDRRRWPDALRLIFRELRRFRDTVPGPRELRRAKDYAIGQLRLGLESTTHQMMWIGDNILSYDRFITPEEVIAKTGEVTGDDIRTLARSLFRGRSLSVAMVAPALSDAERRALDQCRRVL